MKGGDLPLQACAVLYRSDLLEERIHGLGARLFYRRLVHACRIKVTDQLSVTACFVFGFGILFEDLSKQLVVILDKLVERAPTRFRSRDLRILHPCSVHVLKKIVARRGRLIHSTYVEWLRLRQRLKQHRRCNDACGHGSNYWGLHFILLKSSLRSNTPKMLNRVAY